MNELERVKKQAHKIMMGMTNDFILITHDHIEDDVWEAMCRSESTGKYYIFKSEGSDFYDFKEKP
jgi:hypothetical protein